MKVDYNILSTLLAFHLKILLKGTKKMNISKNVMRIIYFQKLKQSILIICSKLYFNYKKQKQTQNKIKMPQSQNKVYFNQDQSQIQQQSCVNLSNQVIICQAKEKHFLNLKKKIKYKKFNSKRSIKNISNEYQIANQDEIHENTHQIHLFFSNLTSNFIKLLIVIMVIFMFAFSLVCFFSFKFVQSQLTSKLNQNPKNILSSTNIRQNVDKTGKNTNQIEESQIGDQQTIQKLNNQNKEIQQLNAKLKLIKQNLKYLRNIEQNQNYAERYQHDVQKQQNQQSKQSNQRNAERHTEKKQKQNSIQKQNITIFQKKQGQKIDFLFVNQINQSKYQGQKKQQEKVPEYLEEKYQNNSQSIKDTTISILIQNSTNLPKFTIRDHLRVRPFQNNQNRDYYDLKVSIQQIISSSQLQKTYQYSSIWREIKKKQYQIAIRLLQVVHNINFKGQFIFDHFDYYQSPQKKYQALKEILIQEKNTLQKNYQISKYIHNQIRFCICVSSYNNAKTRLYLRNLDSIFQQQYQNYHVVYINDASDDGTGEYVQKYMKQNNIPSQKYKIVNNPKRQGLMKNLYSMGNQHCQLRQIMIIVDGDDSLIGRQVFSLFNAVYQKYKVALAYTQYFKLYTTKIINGRSKTIPQYLLRKDGAYRSLRDIYGIHTNSMYVELFRKINRQSFQYQNGTFFNYASDNAYFTPAVQMVGLRLKYVPVITYQYRKDQAQTHDSNDLQKPVRELISTYKKYKKLDQMPFADNPITTFYQ